MATMQPIIKAGLISVGMLCGITVGAYAQHIQQSEQIVSLVESVVRSVESGAVDALLQSADQTLGIELVGERATYSRPQAYYVLKRFFEEHPPVRFLLQKQQRTQGNLFVIGQLTDKKGHRYRVYLRFRKRENTWKLKEFRINQTYGKR